MKGHVGTVQASFSGLCEATTRGGVMGVRGFGNDSIEAWGSRVPNATPQPRFPRVSMWLCKRARILSWFLLLTPSLDVCVGSASAGEIDSRDRLSEIRAAIDAESARVEEVGAKKASLQQEIAKLQSRVRVLSDQRAAAQRELSKIESSQREVRVAIEQADREIVRLQNLSAERVRAVYMTRSDTLLEHLLQVGGSRDFARSTVYLSRIRRADERIFDEMRMLGAQRLVQSRKLEAGEQLQREAAARLEKQVVEIRAQTASKERAQSDLKREEKKLIESLASLRAQALRFETVLKSITGGTTDEILEARGSTPQTETKLEYEGRGFQGPRRGIPPVVGRKLKGYGPSKDPAFRGVGGLKGLEYLVAEGASPVAILAGRVIYVGEMPRIGVVVIVDHGARDYSLYGRLKSASVSVGSEVEEGQALGIAGGSVDGGPNFYFEIRRRGETVSPEGVIRLK